MESAKEESRLWRRAGTEGAVKRALYIDCCIRGKQSRTRKVAEAFLAALPKTWKVTTVNLMREDLRPLSGEFFAGREELLQTGKIDDVRFDRARQLAAADLVVIAAPFWDMSFPALLKIYIENVSVEGITFRGTEEGLRGLCRAEQMCIRDRRGHGGGDAAGRSLVLVCAGLLLCYDDFGNRIVCYLGLPPRGG